MRIDKTVPGRLARDEALKRRNDAIRAALGLKPASSELTSTPEEPGEATAKPAGPSPQA